MRIKNLTGEDYLVYLKQENIDISSILPEHRVEMDNIIVDKIVKRDFFNDFYYVPDLNIGEGKLVSIIEDIVDEIPIGSEKQLEDFETQIEFLCQKYDYYMGRGQTKEKRFERVLKHGEPLFTQILEGRGKTAITQKDDEISNIICANFEQNVLSQLGFDSIVVGDPLVGTFGDLPIKSMADLVGVTADNKTFHLLKVLPYWDEESLAMWRFSRPDVLLAAQEILLKQKYESFIDKGWKVECCFLPLCRRIDDLTFSKVSLRDEHITLALNGTTVELKTGWDGVVLTRRIKGLVDYLNIRQKTDFFESYFI